MNLTNIVATAINYLQVFTQKLSKLHYFNTYSKDLTFNAPGEKTFFYVFLSQDKSKV